MAFLWIIALSASGFMASIATNTIGVGGGLLVMPLLALWFPAQQVVVFTTPMFLANAIATLLNYRHSWNVPRALRTIPWVLLGIFGGVGILVHESSRDLDFIIAAIALAFVGYEVFQRTMRRQILSLPTWAGMPIGIVAGGISAISNIGGTLLSLYILSPEVTPDGFVGSLALLYVVMTLSKLGLFWFHHLLTWQTLWWSIPSIPAITAGALVGKKLHHRIQPGVFRPIVITVILASSILLIATSL